MTLLVVIPTVTGREESYRRCLRAYRATTPGDTQYYVERDADTCGEVWNTAMRVELHERCDVIHFSADDLEPREGWYEAAMSMIERDAVPAPYVYNGTSGELEMGGLWGTACLADTPAPMTTIPFFKREWWDAGEWFIPAQHYFSDNSFSSHVLGSGRQILTTPDFAFDHHWSTEGRKQMQGDDWNRERAVWAEIHASYGLA